ncbi:MAG: hypothetical protein WBE90_03365 [Xanthobacteraceae bacterium]
MLTTILAYVIAFLGLIMIAAGIWGLFHLLGQTRPIPLRYYAMAIGMICGGVVMEGVAQTLRILLVLVAAVKQVH